MSPKLRHTLASNPAALLRLSCLSACLALPLGAATDALSTDASDGSVETLSSLEVSGTRPSQVDGSVLKMPQRILETPRSMTVIDSARIEEQNFQSGNDLLLWVPGLNSNGDSYHFYARGFRQLPADWKVDGFSGRVLGGSYAPNLFGVESVTLLKGPASLLYGAASSPGGQILLTTKKPRDLASTTVSTRLNTYGGGGASFGEHNGAEFELDTTGPVEADKRGSYRFLADLDYGKPKSFVSDRNQFYRLNFTQKLDKAGSLKLTPMLEWSREYHEVRGLAISPSSSLSTADGRTDYTLADLSTSDINLGAGGRTDTNRTTGFDLDSSPSEGWKSALSFRYQDRRYTNNAWTVDTTSLAKANAADPLSWTVKRKHGRARNDYSNTSLDLHTQYEFLKTDAWRSLIQTGANGQRQMTYAWTGTTGASQSPINLYSGIASTPLVADANPNLAYAGFTRVDVYNLYLQSQTSFNNQLTLSVSGAFAGDHTETASAGITRHSGMKPNASLVYLPTPQISLYTSYSTSYSLPTYTYQDKAGKAGGFDPITGTNLEAGAKAELLKGLLAASFDVFRTQIDNPLTQSATTDLNPNGVQYYTQTGYGRRSQGAELEFTLAPAKGFTNTVGYAYIDAFNRNADGSRGARAEMTPRHAFSDYARYQFTSGALRGLGLNAGFIWQAKRIGGNSAPTSTAPDPLWLKAFHRVDLGLTYRTGRWSYSLNIENIENTRYVLTGSTGLALELGNPRSYSLKSSYTW